MTLKIGHTVSRSRFPAFFTLQEAPINTAASKFLPFLLYLRSFEVSRYGRKFRYGKQGMFKVKDTDGRGKVVIQHEI